MSMEKFKRFVEDHKKELIATTAVAGGIVLVILGCKRHSGKAVKAKGIFSIPIEREERDGIEK